MRSARRLVGALFVVCSLVSAGPALAAPAEPSRLTAAAAGQLVEAPGTEARAEIVTFGGGLAPALLRLAPGETARIAGWPVSPGTRADVRVTRFEIYAPDAKIWKVEGDALTEVPRSRSVFFRGWAEDAPETRIFIALHPGAEAFEGLAVSPAGSFEIRPHPEAAHGRGHLVTVPDYFLPETGEAQPLGWTCGQSGAPLEILEEMDQVEKRSALAREVRGTGDDSVDALFESVIASLHSVTVAVDTDNELMLQKFADNTTNAANYIAALIAAMNVIYERDLNIRLLQGTTFLRVSTVADPWNQTGSGASVAQLGEFSNYWSTNNNAIARGLAMMLSGKGSNQFSSSGIAWVPGLCSVTTGYSFTQVFKFVGSTGATDAFVVGHELGHNFGSPHTHCYSPPIDNCFVEGGSCYSGPTSCPAATTINGVSGVTGTLMSYCHILGGGCTASNVFHSRTVDLISAYIQPRVGVCVFPAITPPTVALVSPSHGRASGGTSVTITGTGFQSGAGVSFGGTAAASVTFNSATQLTAVTPSRAAGLVGVTVTNPDTGNATASNAFTFDAAPAILAVTPNNGPTAGGTSVLITGTGFQSGAAVSFGGTAAASVTFNSSTQLTAVAPAHAMGTVSLSVTNPDTQNSTRTNGFFYAPPPEATDFYTLTPCRIFDSRLPVGTWGGPVLSAGGERAFAMAGLCGIPADATAVTVNITVVTPAAGGYLSIDPGNAFFLGTAVMTFQTGEILSNNATVLLATDGSGSIRLLNGSTGTTHVIVDVTGYYAEE